MAYGGLVGAFLYAARRSDSWLFRSYAVASALAGAFVAVLLALALVSWVANPTGAMGERAFLGVVAVLILGPLFAPVLVVARRHRLDRGRRRDDLALGAAGYGFLAAVYLALFVSRPGDAASGGIVGAVDALPRVYGLVPPAVAAALIAAAVVLTRE